MLDELDLTEVTVIGNSLGGWIAAELALAGSPRISGVVMVDAVGIEVPGHPMAGNRAALAVYSGTEMADPSLCRVRVAARHRLPAPAGDSGPARAGYRGLRPLATRPQLQRDVGVRTLQLRCLGDRAGQRLSGVGGRDNLVDDTDVDGTLEAAGCGLVFGR